MIAVKLFELDETERVNVTRNFVDMKLIERSHEREAFRMARKLGKFYFRINYMKGKIGGYFASLTKCQETYCQLGS